MYRSRRPIRVAPSRYPTLLSPTMAVVSPVRQMPSGMQRSDRLVIPEP